MVHAQRLTAALEGEFVVFLIGMRVNQPLRIHKWLPAVSGGPTVNRHLGRHHENRDRHRTLGLAWRPGGWNAHPIRGSRQAGRP